MMWLCVALTRHGCEQRLDITLNIFLIYMPLTETLSTVPLKMNAQSGPSEPGCRRENTTEKDWQFTQMS